MDELLGQVDDLSETIGSNLKNLLENRNRLREALSEEINLDRELGHVEAPTTCGTDGSYVVERLLSVDIAAYGAVALEGLIPPSERRHWSDPHHFTHAYVASHNDRTGVVLRAIMIAQELNLAVEAPHDVVMIDGSMTTPIIFLNQALNSLSAIPSGNLRDDFVGITKVALDNYLDILTSPRSDKTYIGLPKYTSRREVARKLDDSSTFEDRGILTFVLEPGEFVGPYHLDPDRQEGWHLNVEKHPDPSQLESKASEIATALDRLSVVYYKPRSWLPAIRLEVAERVVSNRQRLGQMLEGIRYQCPKGSIFEPYPIYIADRIVKHLARAVPAIRQASAQSMAIREVADAGSIYLAMRDYRTETGR